MRNLYFLRIGEDHLEDARAYQTKRGAVAAFGRVARDLARIEQRIDASIHIAPRSADTVDYPDFVLTLGPRGGVRVEST